MTSTQNMAKHGEQGQYRSDQSSSYSESNVFSLTDMEEGVSEFTTITSYADDLTMGLGTYNPSCRLSFGKNTANTFANEFPKQSIPAICLNEESDGTDATGISFYERFDEITGERAEAGMAFVVSNENYATTYDGTVFTNTIDVSQNKTIAMSILSRTSGHNAVLINHDPAQTTQRAVFGNERVSMDVSGAIRSSQFFILGNLKPLVDNPTDFNALNDGTIIFDGTSLYIKQVGIQTPAKLLLSSDADAGTATEFEDFTSGDSVLGIFQGVPTLFGLSTVGENIFKNTLSVFGNYVSGSVDYINNNVYFLGEDIASSTGCISVEKAIGVNVHQLGAAIDVSASDIPYAIMGLSNTKADISGSAFVIGDGNRFIGTKSVCFGDNNIASGTHNFNIGVQNESTGSDCFIQGREHQTDINKSIVFGEFNIVLDTEKTTAPNKNQFNFVSGYNNTLTDGSSNYIFGTNIDTSGVSYTTAIGYNADVSGDLKFVLGTEALNGNAFTIDHSGNTQIEGDIKCLTNKNKSIFDNCDHNITVGNANTLTLFPGEIANYSDERLKFNIETIDDSLSKLCQLRGVRYNRNDINNDNKKHIGLIAQEVEKVVPEVVNTENDGNKYLSVSYGNLVSLLIESIKELNGKVEHLTTENNELKTDVATLKQQMQQVLSALNV